MQNFAFGGNTGMTYEQLQKRRELADVLALSGPAPKNVGEGLAAVAKAIIGRSINKKADAREGELRGQFDAQWDSLFGGSTPRGASGGYTGTPSRGPSVPSVSASPLLAPNDPVAISGDTMAALGKDAGTAGYRASLIGTESGGNWKARNNEMGAGGKPGHFGRVQFGQARLQEAMDAGAIPQGTTPEQFMNSPALQIAAENWHFADLERQLAPFVGSEVNGQQMDIGALVAMGHLGGAGGAKRYVQTGGQYNPADAFGTNLSEYAATHGGQPASQPGIGALAELAGSPFASPGQKAVAEALLQQQMQAADPMYRLALEREQLELAQMRQPDAGYRVLTPEEAQGMGLPPGAYQVGPDNKVSTIGGGGTTVNNILPGGEPNDAKLRGKLMEAEGTAWGEYAKAGATAAGMRQDMELLGQVIEMAPQGPIQGRLAAMFPGVSDAAGVFQSVVKRVAPSLRVEGSGAQSDIEYQGFLDSLPALQNRPEANRAITSFLNAKAQINIDRANIVREYQNGTIGAPAARKAMAELDARSIMSPEMEGLLGALDQPSGTPEPGQIENGYRYIGGDPSLPESWEEVQ